MIKATNYHTDFIDARESVVFYQIERPLLPYSVLHEEEFPVFLIQNGAMNLSELLGILQTEMEQHQNPTKAKNMATYLKDRFDCYGIKTPVRNEIQKRWFPLVKESGIGHWDLTYNLWAKDQREYQYVAIDWLKKVPKKQMKKDDDRYLEELITNKSWWDSVDLIASNYVGKYFQQFPEQIESVIGRWRDHHSIWLNRTCLIFQLKYKEDVDFELLKSLIIQYQGNPEFFIQKAIGWSLRQYSKFNPEAVRLFMEEIQLDGLALREASKYL